MGDESLPFPSARSEGLVVRELLEETVVYDRERHTAHCLSSLAARIWRHCDGKTSVAEIAAHLSDETGLAVDEGIVRLALHRLSRAHLLNLPLRLATRSRREWIRTAALLGGLSVLTIAVPAAAQVASCIPDPQCAAMVGPPCPGQPCCSNPNLRCKNNPGQRGCICR